MPPASCCSLALWEGREVKLLSLGEKMTCSPPTSGWRGWESSWRGKAPVLFTCPGWGGCVGCGVSPGVVDDSYQLSLWCPSGCFPHEWPWSGTDTPWFSSTVSLLSSTVSLPGIPSEFVSEAGVLNSLAVSFSWRSPAERLRQPLSTCWTHPLAGRGWMQQGPPQPASGVKNRPLSRRSHLAFQSKHTFSGLDSQPAI